MEIRPKYIIPRTQRQHRTLHPFKKPPHILLKNTRIYLQPPLPSPDMINRLLLFITQIIAGVVQIFSRLQQVRAISHGFVERAIDLCGQSFLFFSRHYCWPGEAEC
jgi:hypothetical protein